MRGSKRQSVGVDSNPLERTKAVTRVSPTTVAQRVERIVGMMRRNEWVRGESAAVLAAEWGLATNTVEQLSSEASRVVAREVTDPERVKVDVSTILMRDIERASAAAEFGDVARIADVVTKIVGAREPERREVDVSVRQYAQLSRERKIELLDAQIAKLQAARAALLKQGSITVPALPEEVDDE